VPTIADELGRFQDPRAKLIVQHMLENPYPMQKFALFLAVHTRPYVKDFMNATNGSQERLCAYVRARATTKPVRCRHPIAGLAVDRGSTFRNRSGA
jgi:hypothetical protein